MNKFSVFVNDVRVNEHSLLESEAEELALKYTEAGYKNVLVVDETTIEEEVNHENCC